MLVISRKPHELITITVPPSAEEKTITVKVVEITRPSRVKIGIEFPTNVDVSRPDMKKDSLGYPVAKDRESQCWELGCDRAVAPGSVLCALHDEGEG